MENNKFPYICNCGHGEIALFTCGEEWLPLSQSLRRIDSVTFISVEDESFFFYLSICGEE